MLLTVWAVILTGLVPMKAWAISGSARIGFDSAYQVTKVFSANAPLPMLHPIKGTWKLSLTPANFNGKLDLVHKFYKRDGSFKGFGGSGSLSYSFADKWAVYVLGMGSSLSGDFQSICIDCTWGDDYIKDVKASFIVTGGGVTYELFHNPYLTIPIFAGPSMTRFSTSQRITQYSNNVLVTDYDLESKPVFIGYMAGVQAGVTLGKYFKFNPFFIYSDIAGDECKKFTPTEVRLDSLYTEVGVNNSVASTGQCQSQSKTGLINFDGTIITGGLNAIYEPLGLSFNVTAPFLRRSFSDAAGTDVALITLSWSFGNYVK
ncbi:MAG: hypothetical protein AABZ44_05480 [Elusimicrobiota bacterium]